MQFRSAMVLCCIVTVFECTQGKKHKLKIQDDYRNYIALTSFGFYKGGYLILKMDEFSFISQKNTLFGFTLERVFNSGFDSRMEKYKQGCFLRDSAEVIKNKENVIFFVMDFIKQRMETNCSAFSNVEKLQIYPGEKRFFTHFVKNKKRRDFSDGVSGVGASCVNFTAPITVKKLNNTTSSTWYSTEFTVYFPTEQEEGLYELFFYNCANYENDVVSTSFSIFIEERNAGNYLSAGEMPLPALYFVMSIIFFLSALFWMCILWKSRSPVFKIHHLMAALVILKSLGLLFHGINYHYIEVKGEHVVTWAVLYYITHLLKGSVLFITIILIGTGWTFIKHILSPKDKKIFMIVIPLQVFAIVAEIILEESEEGDAEHRIWLDVFTFVDLICCLAILFPIVWSIKHLQDASRTDGKADINLKKLKLFRHFYIMIVCYIYFTRIIVYLLKMTVPFRYEWLDEIFKEISTFIFFVLTGYKFRPTSANAYFHVDEENIDDNDSDLIVKKCDVMEGFIKLSSISNETGENDRDTLLIYRKESSHDYD